MGGGLSKKQKAAAESKSRARAPPPPAANPHAQARGFDDDGWEVERVRNDGWEPVPYALLCPDVEVVDSESPRGTHHEMRGPFDTPNGGAGVGSLSRNYLGAPQASSAGGEMSDLPPTALSVEVLEVGGLNELATPVPLPASHPMSIPPLPVSFLASLCWGKSDSRLFYPCTGQGGASSRYLLRGGGRGCNTRARQPGIRGDGPGEILRHKCNLPLA